MFKKYFGSFLVGFLGIFLFSSTLSAQSQFVMAKQLMFTNHGIIVNIDGSIMVTAMAVYVGHGIYEINDEYYGSCLHCGWPLSKEGQCTHQNCNNSETDGD